MNEKLLARLSQRKASALWRQRVVIEKNDGCNIVVDGRSYTNFSSNDYLGLSQHPALIAAANSVASSTGVGATASHLVCGHHQQHEALEYELAEITGRERALVFSSGYMANQAVLSCLLDKNDAVFHDRLNHASLLDGAVLSGAKSQRFLHNDLANLERRLQRSNAETKIIAVDGVFSMDGDIAQLPGLLDLAERFNAMLMVDDAHGFGVLGETGLGSCQHFSLSAKQVPILMATFGKALGVSGAFVAGSHELIESLIQFGRSYIYTTALPPNQTAAVRAALKLMQDEPAHRLHLLELIALFRKGAKARQLSVIDSPSAIQPVFIGDEQQALNASEKLKARGFWVSAIREPTVARGQARLRVALSAAHDVAQVEALLDALQEISRP